MLIRSFFAVFCLFLSGCFAHSFPTANSFIEVGEVSDHKAEVVQVFVDANGTFYPNGWQRFSSIRSPWKADSLLNSLDEGEALRSLIEKEEVRQLQEIKNAADRSDRIFVLIHGFNNTVDEAMPAYSEIERKLDLREDDLVVRFYWDGLTGKRGGQAKIWFNAVGYSQLAGLRGLRRMLSQINDKPIYLISHSRGASVITSALANPVYDPDFLEDTQAVVRTWGSEYQNFFAPGPVAENENRFHILMLAPAIDRVDFCDESQQRTTDGGYDCKKFKNLGQQLASLRYTVNTGDPILDKIVGLSNNFNPTGLGVDPKVGAFLRANHYPFMVEHKFDRPMGDHKFLNYVKHSSFDAMLAEEGIGKTD